MGCWLSGVNFDELFSVVVDARAGLQAVPQFYKKIGDIVPSGCYFKFHDIWRITTTKVEKTIGLNLSFQIFPRER